MGSSQIFLRIRPPLVFCIFERRPGIKCKLSKSRTKWTGLTCFANLNFVLISDPGLEKMYTIQDTNYHINRFIKVKGSNKIEYVIFFLCSSLNLFTLRILTGQNQFFKKYYLVELWPSPLGTFHILRKFAYFIIRFYCRAMK